MLKIKGGIKHKSLLSLVLILIILIILIILCS